MFKVFVLGILIGLLSLVIPQLSVPLPALAPSAWLNAFRHAQNTAPVPANHDPFDTDGPREESERRLNSLNADDREKEIQRLIKAEASWLRKRDAWAADENRELDHELPVYWVEEGTDAGESAYTALSAEITDRVRPKAVLFVGVATSPGRTGASFLMSSGDGSGLAVEDATGRAGAPAGPPSDPVLPRKPLPAIVNPKQRALHARDPEEEGHAAEAAPVAEAAAPAGDLVATLRTAFADAGFPLVSVPWSGLDTPAHETEHAFMSLLSPLPALMLEIPRRFVDAPLHAWFDLGDALHHVREQGTVVVAFGTAPPGAAALSDLLTSHTHHARVLALEQFLAANAQYPAELLTLCVAVAAGAQGEAADLSRAGVQAWRLGELPLV